MNTHGLFEQALPHTQRTSPNTQRCFPGDTQGAGLAERMLLFLADLKGRWRLH